MLLQDDRLQLRNTRFPFQILLEGSMHIATSQLKYLFEEIIEPRGAICVMECKIMMFEWLVCSDMDQVLQQSHIIF